MSLSSLRLVVLTFCALVAVCLFDVPDLDYSF
jgi:hypothetical protein